MFSQRSNLIASLTNPRSRKEKGTRQRHYFTEPVLFFATEWCLRVLGITNQIHRNFSRNFLEAIQVRRIPISHPFPGNPASVVINPLFPKSPAQLQRSLTKMEISTAAEGCSSTTVTSSLQPPLLEPEPLGPLSRRLILRQSKLLPSKCVTDNHCARNKPKSK